MSGNEELLSAEEMAALVPPFVPATDLQSSSASAKRPITLYNFRRPDRLSKEEIRSLYLLHDMFAHALSSSLPLFLRAASEVNLISVDQQSYGDYLKGLSDPTTIFTVSAKSLHGVFAVELGSSIAFPVIDRMLGGEGRGLAAPRAATELELKVLEGFLAVVNESYRESWKPHVELETEIVGRETRPQLLQIIPPNGIVVTVVYQMQVGDAKGLMSICLPVEMLEPVIKKANAGAYSSGIPTPPEATHALLTKVSNVAFEVASDLEPVPAAVADLMSLGVGDVLRTNHSLDRPLNISVAELQKFTGRLGSIEGKLVVQVTGGSGEV
jgi:flagellar motor switch protein FliM